MTSVETAVEHGVAPTFVVLNDTSLGMVRQMQHAPDDIAGVEFHDTDFARARRRSARSDAGSDACELATALDEGTSADVPVVIDVRIDRVEEMVESLQSSFYKEVGGLHGGSQTRLRKTYINSQETFI